MIRAYSADYYRDYDRDRHYDKDYDRDRDRDYDRDYDRDRVGRGQVKTVCDDCEYSWKCAHEYEYAVGSCAGCPQRMEYEKEEYGD